MDKGTTTAAAVGVANGMLADQWSLHLFGVPVSVVIAAFAGAFFSLSWQKRIPATAKCAAVWMGTFLGAYFTPLIVKHGGLDVEWQFAIAIVIGAVGEPALHRLYQRVPQLVDKRTGTGDEK